MDDFLKKLVEDNSEYELSAEDEKVIKHQGLRQFIFNKLNSSKFRATSTEEGYQKKILDKIDLCLKHELPIYISLPFGAAKNPYLPTAPGVDWAEVFNIAFLREYLKPIAKAYKHGVILEYISVAVFEEKVNRIPKEDTDLYDKEFIKLIGFFQKYLPKNLQIKFSRVEDKISREEIEEQLSLKMDELRKVWDKQSEEVRERKLFRARRNCLIKSGEENAEGKILNSALGHDAFCSECWTTQAAPWDEKMMITLGHNYTSGWAIHVRSTPGSSVNFWSGVGVLVKNGKKFVPTVLSPQQFEAAKFEKNKSGLFEDFSNLGEVIVSPGV